MGGKKKQACRTKGNARPSSSGRTAEKLASAGNALPGFIGFTGLPVSTAALGATGISQAAEEIDVRIDGEVRMAMKKMMKRDVTTKLKALQEFGALCQDMPEDEIKALLACWPRLFNRLSMDHDRRVRESLLQAHEHLVVRTRRNLAPHLRSIMGCWLVAQCDPYAPAACAAQSSFSAAFPPYKHAEAIAFCKNEVIALIEDNILHQTAKTLSDPDISGTEEMEAKYIRIVASSLLAWKLLFNKLAKNEHETIVENYKKIVGDVKFWKLPKHQSPMIRQAWFSLISTLCQCMPSLLIEKKLCPLVLSSLDETDPTVSPSVWEAAMLTLVTVDDCWKHVNARKAVLPKLWAVLQQGGYGNASAIYPNLLPFLHKVPPEVMGDPMQFYMEFFDHMRKGLMLTRTQSSPSEMSSIVQSYMECLKYILVQHDENQAMKIEEIIVAQLLSLFRYSLLDKTSKLYTTSLNELLAEFIRHWHKGAESVNNYLNVQTQFFKLFEDLCMEIVNSKDNLDRLAELFVCILGGKVSRQNHKVQFTDEIEQNVNLHQNNITVLQQISYLEDEQHPLHQLLCNICDVALTNAKDSASLNHLKFVATITYCHSSRKLLSHLSKQDKNASASEIGRIFYSEIVCPLSQILQLTSQPGFASVYSNLGLSAYQCVDVEKAKIEILGGLYKMKDAALVECLLQQISYRRQDKVFLKWLRSEELEATLQELAWKLCCIPEDKTCKDADVIWRLLSLCFATDENSEPVISSSCLGRILNTFKDALSRDNLQLEASLEFVCTLASKLFVNFKDCWQIPSSIELLLTMFVITCQPPNALSEEILDKVETTWLSGVNTIISMNGGLLSENSFFSRVSTIVLQIASSDNVTAKGLTKLINTVKKLALKVFKAIGIEDNVKYYSEFINQFLPTANKWSQMKQQLSDEWFLTALMEDQLVFTDLPIKGELPYSFESNFGFISTAAFTALLLTEFHKETELFGDNPSSNLFPIFLHHIKEVVYGSVYWNMIAHKKKSADDLFLAQCFEEVLQIIVQNKSDFSNKIYNELRELSGNEGMLWPLCCGMFAHILGAKETCPSNWDDCEVPVAILSTNEFHSAFIKQEILPTSWNKNPTAGLLNTNSETDFEFLVQLLSLTRKQMELFDVEDTRAQDYVKKVLDFVVGWRDEKAEILLYACDVSARDWLSVCFNAELQKLILVIVNKFTAFVEPQHWDFILCGLYAWLQSCVESQNNLWKKLTTLYYVYECCTLFKSLTCIIEKKSNEALTSHPELIIEWNEFFSEGLYKIILPFVVSVSELKSNTALSYMENKLLTTICGCVELIPLHCLEKHDLSKSENDSGEGSQIPEKLKGLLLHFCPLLSATVRPIQLCAFRILAKIIPSLAKYNEEKLDDSAETLRCIPSSLNTLLTETTVVVNSFFAEDSPNKGIVSIDPESTVYSFMMCYLLAWDLIMELFSAASSELRSEYAAYLESSGLMHDLLANIFYLIPENATLPANSAQEANKVLMPKTMFTEKPALSASDSNSSLELQHQACQVYFKAVKKLPAMVRQWLNNQDKHMLALVERITSKYVSVILSTEELQSVHNSGKNFDNMTVRARVKTREVIATYTIDEVSMELIIKLASNHPLGPVVVECGKRIGVGNTQWRNWMLQLSTFLMYQNGSILDGLTLWKRNIDKKFEGIEECYICFYVLHGSNCQLPRLTCRTCKKKFHSACLYKWFSTSNQSTCPLCRNLF